MCHSRLALPAALLSFALWVLAAPAWAQPGGGPPGISPSEVEVVNTPSVEVVNTPSVEVTNTPSVEVVNVPEVEVVNSPSVDLLPGAEVRDRDNPALQPTHFRCEIELPDLDQNGDAVCGDPLPAGRRLVVEYISVRIVSPQWPTAIISIANLDPSGSPRGIEWNIPVEDCGPLAPATNCWQGAGPVRLYHTTQNMVLRFQRRGPFTGTARITADFSGHYVGGP